MLQDQLKGLYALVGEIATEFNYIEVLWYLIFTGLMHSTPRPVVDTIFGQFRSGAVQRTLIRRTAVAAFPDNSSLLATIDGLSKTTSELARRRNQVMHGVIYIADFIIPRRITVMGTRPSDLASKEEVEPQLTRLLADIEYHSLDVQALRLQIIELIHPTMNIDNDKRNLERSRQEVENKHPR